MLPRCDAARGLRAFAVVLALAAGPAGAQAPTEALAAAAAARAAGDDARALQSYDQALAAEPRNATALRESARILWRLWNRAEALRRYRALAAVRPLDADEAAEFAGWLVDNAEPGPVLALVDPLLEQTPGHRGLRLARARALSALERRGEARAEALRVLERYPDDVEACNLIAGTYHWGGQPEFAREWYERALAADPGNFAAELGLSTLDATADPRAAAGAVDRMVARHGHNVWIDQVATSLASDARPTLATGYYERESEQERFRVVFGQLTWKLGSARSLELTAAQAVSRIGSSIDDGTLASGQAVYTFPGGPRQRWIAKGGLALRTDEAGASRLSPYGAATWEWGVGEKLRGQIAAGADPYVLAVTSLTGALDIAGTSALVQRRFASGFSLEARGGAALLLLADAPDGHRWEAQFKARQEWRLFGRAPADLSYSYSHFEHPDPVQSPGYFAPRRFSSHTLQAGVSGAIPPRLSGRRFAFSVSAAYSRMSYATIEDSSFSGTAMGAFHLGNGLEIGALLIRSNGSLTVGWPASESTQLGFGIRFVPQPRTAR
jgi:tetratricopeptide (TPR) repeat protein